MRLDNIEGLLLCSTSMVKFQVEIPGLFGSLGHGLRISRKFPIQHQVSELVSLWSDSASTRVQTIEVVTLIINCVKRDSCGLETVPIKHNFVRLTKEQVSELWVLPPPRLHNTHCTVCWERPSKVQTTSCCPASPAISSKVKRKKKALWISVSFYSWSSIITEWMSWIELWQGGIILVAWWGSWGSWLLVECSQWSVTFYSSVLSKVISATFWCDWVKC